MRFILYLLIIKEGNRNTLTVGLLLSVSLACPDDNPSSTTGILEYVSLSPEDPVARFAPPLPPKHDQILLGNSKNNKALHYFCPKILRKSMYTCVCWEAGKYMIQRWWYQRWDHDIRISKRKSGDGLKRAWCFIKNTRNFEEMLKFLQKCHTLLKININESWKTIFLTLNLFHISKKEV